MALRRLLQKPNALSGYPQRVVTISSYSCSTSSSLSYSHPSPSSSSSPLSYPTDSHSQPNATPTSISILSVPHPRVRSLYKELLSVCQHHPTFPMSKCRQKIKEGFARNKNIAVYADGSGYTAGKGEALHMPEEAEGQTAHGWKDRHTIDNTATESASLSKRGGGGELFPAACCGAENTANSSGGSIDMKEDEEKIMKIRRRSECDEEVAVLNGLGLRSSISSSSGSSSSPSSHDRHRQDTLETLADRRRDAGLHYSKDFMRALAWGRYAVRDTEALINFHKYRAMKARYEWKKDDGNQ